MPGETLIPLLLTTGGAIAALMVLTWLWSLKRKDAGVVELAWPLGLMLVAGIALLMGEASGPRRLLLPALVGLWGTRLLGYLVWRNLVAHLHPGADLNDHEDRRRRIQRRKAAQHFWWQSLVTVFGARGLKLWLVALPVVVFQAIPGRTDLSWLDYLGTAIVLLGLAMETIADAQLSNFKLNPGSHGQVLTWGLWRFSRHPNYFGEFLVGWGLFAVAMGSGHAMLATVIGPLVLTAMLVLLNGVRPIEQGMADRRPAYARYVEQTSAFLPLPSRAPKAGERSHNKGSKLARAT